MDKPALFGGKKTKITPFGSGKRFGEEEKKEVLEALASDVLFYAFGTKVREMEAKMRGMYGLKHCNGCSSGTAAVHIAVGALQLKPGKEVITSAITDMGTLTGILYQCLIPRFADIDPETYNLDPQEVERLITAKTGAIVVVHHAGLPAEIDELKAIAGRYGLPLVEDCAQAWYARYKGKLCGTFGDISTFSLNHFKLISSGSGGMVMSDRDDLEEVVRLFIDKCYFRDGRARNPYFLAPNYQMTELQGAVAKGQLDKISSVVERRQHLGMKLIGGLEQIAGVKPQKVDSDRDHCFFLLVVRLDPRLIQATPKQFCQALEAEGVHSEPNKITGGMPTYMYDIFQKRSAFPGSLFPFVSRDLDSDVSYPKGICPQAEQAFEQTFNFHVDEFYTEQDIDDMIRATEKVAHYYRVKKA